MGVGPDGKPEYGPDLDASGAQKIGPVTHSYSIASAPFETVENGFLEFYVVLEVLKDGSSGRLTESLFQMQPEQNNKVTYFDRITGNFTLDERTNNFDSVLMIGTGTGLAPFIAMMKHLHDEAAHGRGDGRKYTVLHTNRTYEELAYHQDLLDIEASGKLDFVYVPSVSRPAQQDIENKAMCRGRANNVLRHIFDLPMKEEEALREAKEKGEDTVRAQAALDKTVRPVLAQQISPQQLRGRFDAAKTVIMTCGNPWSMADIELTAKRHQIHFEMEEW